jgi:hypothetical protein
MNVVFGRLVLAAAAAAGALALAGLPAEAQPASAFGAREPATCASRAAPAQGAPSNEQAVQYVKCTVEGIGDGRMFLLEDVKVQVTPQGRAYNTSTDYFDDIDARQQIYPIKGSLVRYECEETTLRGVIAGKNCRQMIEANASGACYKTTANEWACNMSDVTQKTTEGVAPPK